MKSTFLGKESTVFRKRQKIIRYLRLSQYHKSQYHSFLKTQKMVIIILYYIYI